MLLTKKVAYYFKFNTDDPIVFVILPLLNDSLYVSMFFMKTNWMANWDSTIWIAIVEKHTL